MGLFEKIFRPKAEKIQADSYWQTFTSYTPQFYSVDGQIYEILLVRAAIDFRARQNAKLKVQISGTANKALRSRAQLRPSAYQSWSQFLYRL